MEQKPRRAGLRCGKGNRAAKVTYTGQKFCGKNLARQDIVLQKQFWRNGK